MNRNYNTFFLWSALVLCLVFSSTQVYSQFEQKLTVNMSGSFVYPDMLEEFTSYGNGLGLDGGLQFNINRTVSFYGSARFYYMFGLSDYSDAYYSNIAFGGGLKLNILPTKKINPYAFAEANLNFIWLDEYNYETSYYNDEFGTSIGGLGGLGIDFKLNDNIALFIQSGAYFTFWDKRINLYSQAGLRINMIKSKTI